MSQPIKPTNKTHSTTALILAASLQFFAPPAPAADAPVGSALGATFDAGYYHTCAIRFDGSLLCWGSNGNGQSTVPASSYSVVSAGVNHTCGFLTDGSLQCWGRNDYGQSTVPAGSYTAVSAGYLHTCGLLTDGTLKCWGSNGNGQTAVPAGIYSAVSAGSAHTCGLLTDGTLKCWGDNAYGKSTVPAGIYSAVSVGDSHTCGLLTDGTLKCWGRNDYGASTVPAGSYSAVSAGANHTCGLLTDGTLQCWGNNNQGQISVPAGSYRAVSSGDYHTCGLLSDGTLKCWGYNNYGQTTVPAGLIIVRALIQAGLYHTCAFQLNGSIACWGDDSYGQATVPNASFKWLSTGSYHTCGVKADRTLVCWGDNGHGQATPPAGNTFAQVSAGESHSCGIKTDGTVACWGDSAFGQTTVPSGTFTFIDAGDNHTCAIKTDGTVACWGNNAAQQATQPATATFTYVSAGTDHSCGVKTDGTVACWGDNTYEQGTPPTGIFVQVSAGLNHTCGLQTDQTVTCWGTDFEGETIAPTGTFAAVSVNQYHSCGMKTNGTVLCWGNNTFGQVALTVAVTKIGTGTGTVTSAPAGIDCGSSCDAQYDPFTSVTLTATANTGSMFSGWGNLCVSNLPTSCTVPMNLDFATTAKFELQSLNTAPTLTNAVAADQLVILTWNAVPDATSYKLYQGTNADGELSTPVKTGIVTTTTPAIDLTNGTRYYFKLQAVNANGVSPLSNEINATPLFTALIIRAVAGYSQVNLNWNSIPDAATYNVYQGTTAGGESTTPIKTGLTGTSTAITGLTGGTRYYFKMASVNILGRILMSNEVTTIPLTPMPIAPVIQSAIPGGSQVTLNWTAGANAATYNVYQGTTTGGQAATPVKTGLTGTSTVITGLTNTVTYYFKMTSINSRGESPRSNEMSATPHGPSLPTATTVAATDVAVTSATLNGSINPNGAVTTASFELGTTTSYGTNVAATPASIAANAAETTITANKTDLNCNTTYHYRAKGVNSLGTGLGLDQTFTTGTCPAITYTVTPSANSVAGGTFIPNTAQTVAQNSTTSFTVTANTGYTKNDTVTGTCPQGSWSGGSTGSPSVWTTGQITANCSVIFKFDLIPVNSWLTPPNKNVLRDRPFTLEVTANSNSMKIAAYEFIVTFDSNKLTLDQSLCTKGVCKGSYGLPTNVVAINTANSAANTIKITGLANVGEETGPGNDLQLLIVNFKSRTTLGPTPVNLQTTKLDNSSGDSIGTTARGAIVNVMTGVCGDSDGNNVVNIIDALAIARKLVNLPPPPTVNDGLADVDGNGLKIIDALFIARYSVGLLLPPEVCVIGQAL